MDLRVYPLSFKEFLHFNNVGVKTPIDFVSKKQEIERFLDVYLKYGGFPKVVLEQNEENKRQLLATYFEDILVKDVANRYNIREVDKLKNLAVYYLTNISSPHSINSLRGFTKLSNDSLERFSTY